MSPRLELQAVAVAAGGRTLVRSLDARIAAGETWAIVGPNGAGKTLLLRTIAGLRAPHAGSLRIAGQAIERLGAREAARLRAFLPQSLHDAFGARALDVVMLGRHAHLGRWAWEGAEERARAMECLRAVDAGHLAARDVTTLSGGERQRVAIAAILAQAAPLVLMDEPLAHLDLQHQVRVFEHLAARAAASGQAVLLSVHDLSLAARFATHAMLFRGAGRVDCGPVDSVLHEAALSEAFGHRIQQCRIAGRRVFVPA